MVTFSDAAQSAFTGEITGGAAPPSAVPAPLAIPSELLNSVKSGKCILFLGAMAHARSSSGPYIYTNAPPSGTELSERLAAKCGYGLKDRDNLQRVALYFEYKEGENRNSLVRALQNEIYGTDQTGRPSVVPSPALHMLAALPFQIIITTNYDDLFDTALSRANTLSGLPKRPLVRVYKRGLEERAERVPWEDFTEDRPVLLKLHGDFSSPDSVVVTEDDYINFVQKMSDDNAHPVHLSIRTKLMSWPVLFIGYSLRDYDFRLLFRTLRWRLDAVDWHLHYSVDPKPDGVITLVSRREATVTFIERDLWEFVPALYEACIGKLYK